jgi:pimeloyl-ACP methyl ester carboxylesterase
MARLLSRPEPREQRRDREAPTAVYRASGRLRAPERLPEFERPALIAWSADDEFFPLDDGAAVPNSRLAVIERARTFSMLDRPEQLAGLIDDFSSSTPAPHASSAHQSR